ncbi:glycosyltransferase [Nocardioides sp. Soil805]|uniref:glycosyltransferase n=1 Tax=Nocardioides sp. Soil805 TaxID=1736416 RepID=UPI000702CBC0|nr:glycosyltransferase family 2 protein [Nocardioides sp. Soil805]KRF34627.1 glycosyl transferase [Nocardioides sp. Soil805]
MTTTGTTPPTALRGASTRGTVRPAGPLVALLPAHDEEASLGAALDSLRDQTRPPDRIVVVADNCTDRTVEIARARGVEVHETVGNSHKKAGALNQVLDLLLPTLGDHAQVLVMDADCTLDREFLAVARANLREGGLGGCGGTFRGGPGGGLVGTFQRNEYARYERDVRRLRGKALVLTGTASVFPVSVLRDVVAARRDGRLPDRSGAGSVYDLRVLTEDNELSLALLHLGYDILAPAACTLETEVMPTWRDLADQRLRWKRGAIENLVDYGWTPVTRRYWGRQLLSFLGVLATLLYVGSLVAAIGIGFAIQPFWLALTGVFALERVVTVRSRGVRQMALAAPVVIEFVFDIFLQAVQARAFAQAFLGTERKW